MAMDPEKRATHLLSRWLLSPLARSSSPFEERQNARSGRESGKRKLPISELEKYSTLMRTSHSGVRMRKTVSASLSDFAASGWLVSPKPTPALANDQRKARLPGLRSGGLASSCVIGCPAATMGLGSAAISSTM